MCNACDIYQTEHVAELCPDHQNELDLEGYRDDIEDDGVSQYEETWLDSFGG